MIKKLFINILNYGADPWSIRKLARDETCRMDLGSVGRVRDCTGSGPLVKPTSLKDSTANSKRGQVAELKLDR